MNQQETAPAPAELDGRAPCEICGASMKGEHHKSKAHKACREGEPKSGAVKVKAKSFPVEEEAKTREYWIGTLPKCPIQNLTIAGITFPLFTGRAVFDDKCRLLEGSLYRGATINLTAQQVKDIIASVQRRAIRFHGKERKKYVPRLASGDGPKDERGETIPESLMTRRGTTVSVDSGQARDGDVPLAAFVYMIPTDSLDFHGRDREPEPMLEE